MYSITEKKTDDRDLQNYTNVRTKQVAIRSTRNATDAVRRSYYNIEEQKPANYQLCIGIIEGDNIPILSMYLEKYKQFYGITDIKQNLETGDANINAIEVHDSITYWLPIYTKTSYQQVITNIHKNLDKGSDPDDIITTPNYKDNMDAYYNKNHENETPDHNQVCLILFNNPNLPENAPLPILVAYDYNNDSFSIIDEIQRERTGRYQRQHIVCEEIQNLQDISHHWIPVFTAFEYYKYDKDKRTLWRKALATKHLKQKPEMTKAENLRELNKIKPFPQVIRNIVDSDILS